MTNIYDQHQAAFSNVSAYVVLDSKRERVATVAFKHGNSVTCYFHIIGVPMVRDRANGGGYDRCSAAAYGAVRKVSTKNLTAEYQQYIDLIVYIQNAIKDGGQSWDRDLEAAGFTVLQAV